MNGEYEKIKNAEKILIYGAANNAREAIFAIDILFPQKIVGVAVTRKNSQAENLFDYNVREISHYDEYISSSTVVIVAMRPDYYDGVRASLLEKGYIEVLSYGDKNELMKTVHEKLIQHAQKIGKNYYEMKNEWLLKHLRIAAHRMQLEI